MYGDVRMFNRLAASFAEAAAGASQSFANVQEGCGRAARQASTRACVCDMLERVKLLRMRLFALYSPEPILF